SFRIRRGEVFGLLGPNGAGKTTIMKTVMTLTKPDSGKISVEGIDALRSPSSVRRVLGYVPQDVSVDGDLTGYENLLISSKLYFVPRGEREGRIKSVLALMGLEGRQGDLVKTYSGGMMRRLEIAQALVGEPKVLFLDEPSIGLDPAARHDVWQHVKTLNKEKGTTIFLTTHDMMEADELCDRVAIMNRGSFVVVGSPSDLKSKLGGEFVTVGFDRLVSSDEIRDVAEHISGATLTPAISMPSAECTLAFASSAEEAVPSVVKAFESRGVEVNSIRVNKPSLDDVFLKFTSTRMDEAEFAQARRNRRGFRKRSR
ncbi:MAG TPA: ABC transporter ATP-binding protein, partial [Nitrososphaerales archaeon]|nr:ABC transporter ATP-binding protein [Nitrososphaerales archaeon]